MRATFSRRYLIVLQAAVSAGLFAYLATLLDLDALKNLYHSGLLLRLWPLPLVIIASYLIVSLRWHLLLRSLGIAVGRAQAFCMYVVGGFYSVLLPGVLGGDAVRVALCAGATGRPLSTIAISVGAERSLGLLGLTLIGAVAPLALTPAARARLGWEVLGICPLVAVISMVVLGAVYLGIRGIEGFASANSGQITQFAGRLISAATRVRAISLQSVGLTLLLSTLFQAVDILIYGYVGSLLNIDLPWVTYFVVIPVVYLATVIPISLGGLGVREGTLVWLLTKLGVAAGDAVLLAFLVYLNRVVVSMIGGCAQWLPPCAKRLHRTTEAQRDGSLT